MICARQRMLFGRTSSNLPSRFIREIPEELLERGGSTAGSGSEGWEPASSGFTGTGLFGGTGIPLQRVAVPGAPEPRQHREPPRKPPRKPPVAPAIAGGYTPAAGTAPVPDFHKGDMVRHKVFGRGMVVSTQKMGGDMLLEIAFDNVGTKRMMAKTAAQHMSKE